MTIFTKAKIFTILKEKVSSGEINGFLISDSYLRIIKSKRTGFTFKFNQIDEQSLIYILKKKTPKPEIQNIENFYKIQLKKLYESR